jgi:hypothetical protein
MSDPDDHFFMTEAGQFIAGAHRYLSAARVLTDSDEWKNQGRMLQTPALHLLSHGVELLLKYPFIRLGRDQDSVRKEYGHDLVRLWDASENTSLRNEVFSAAALVWEQARESGLWVNDDFSHEPNTVLSKALADLAFLHGQQSSYALRYTIRHPTSAPRPRFLVEAFGYVAERVAMNPGYLES